VCLFRSRSSFSIVMNLAKQGEMGIKAGLKADRPNSPLFQPFCRSGFSVFN
jgi:hypothetical protein